jgi:hypothetical protein
MIIIIVLFALVSLINTQRALEWRTVMQPYASMWDQRDALIRDAVENGTTDLEVMRLPRIANLGDVSRDKDRWINRCIARAYGLETIVKQR